MNKVQIDSGQMSSVTHHLTQSSRTLNRRYVRRPMNIAIEEAARSLNQRKAASATDQPATPSRLVNLRVSAAELASAKAAEAHRAAEAHSAYDQSAEVSMTPARPVTLVPQVIEFGGTDTSSAEPEATENTSIIAETAPEVQPISQPEPAQTETADENNDSTADTDTTEEIDTATLAMNIAADYAAASLEASVKEYGDEYNNYALAAPAPTSTEITVSTPVDPATANSVEAIACATANAIASIRDATEPAQVSEQIKSLKAFAANIKSNPALPEMKELSDTIDKFVAIAAKSTKAQEEAEHTAKVTFSPKVNRAAAKVTKSSAKVMAAHNRAAAKSAMHPAHAITHPTINRGHMSSQALRNRALEQAMQSVATMDESTSTKARRQPAMRAKRKGGVKRFVIALTCATACVIGVIAFVGANIPDVSVRVAAMQTGISASYPSYVPRDYSLGNINSEAGKISMTFNGPDDSSFTLVEEKSSWDSSALLRNYVEPNWHEDYTTTHEQGITIYIANNNSDAIWVNSGVLYQITSSGTMLTKKQIRNIVVSL